MKIGVLSRKASLYSTNRLVEAAKERGHEVRVIDPLRCYMNITSHKPAIHYRGDILDGYDAVIPRIGASITFYGTAVVRQFEMMEVYSVNESVAISRSRDKLRSMQLLARKGIGLPITGFAHSTEYSDDLIELVGGAPLVVKLLEGTQGVGVVLTETPKAAESVIEAFRGLKANILVQEFIKEAGGADIRCFVVGEKVVASMMRKGKEGEFRSNLHRGGSASVIKITPEERSTAVRSARIMGLNVAGVDILRSNHGPVVMEVNSSPGLEGIENATGKNVAGIIIEFIEKTPAREKPGPAAMAKSLRTSLNVGDVVIKPGEKRTVDLQIARLYTYSEVTMPIHVIHSRQPGPALFISAAIHGDELNGVEIIRRLLHLKALQRLRGTLMAVPVVNVYGLIHHIRYLPDRRDLNRFFPGSAKGSLTSRLAHLFMSEIVSKCTHGIDLHTGSNHRSNLPQVRANLQDEETARLARIFGAPVVLDANVRDGSLRQSVAEQNIPMLLYEAGEALRFNEAAIRTGVRGLVAVMRDIGMLPKLKGRPATPEPLVPESTSWIRAPRSGILQFKARLGDVVKEGQLLAGVSDPFGGNDEPVLAPAAGLVIGQLHLPLVYRGDAIYHLAYFDRNESVLEKLDAFEEGFEHSPDLHL